MFRTLVLRLTHRLWNREISRILCRARGDGLISSQQLHELAAAFDPTQRHRVYGAGAVRGFKEAIRGSHIKETARHDAGAIAQCSYCRRYTDDPRALEYDSIRITGRAVSKSTSLVAQGESPNDLRCECGKTRGWSGSFKRPTADSHWSNVVPGESS